MNDSYQYIEKKTCLTRSALEVIASNHFPVHVITKSDLVLRDIEILERIASVYAAVTFTVTTVNESLQARIEPNSPPASARFEAMRLLSESGIHVGITLMPVLPYLTDSVENITSIIDTAARFGAEYIIGSFGVTLRDRQRDYFLEIVESIFPELADRYRQQFGLSYLCRSENASQLETVFKNKCCEKGISTSIPVYDPLDTGQLSLF